jgi:hypothetical protein
VFDLFAYYFLAAVLLVAFAKSVALPSGLTKLACPALRAGLSNYGPMGL